jgi:hypothetical protein
MTEYLSGKKPTKEQLTEWIDIYELSDAKSLLRKCKSSVETIIGIFTQWCIWLNTELGLVLSDESRLFEIFLHSIL